MNTSNDLIMFLVAAVLIIVGGPMIYIDDIFGFIGREIEGSERLIRLGLPTFLAGLFILLLMWLS